MSKKNTSLAQVQETLAELADSLNAAKWQTDDPEKIRAINNELIEVNHRITMTGALLFHQQTAEIIAAAEQVENAKADVEAEIEKIDKLNDFIAAVSGFLGLVDRVVDLAKAAIP